MALAAEHGTTLPATPDSVELNNFLEDRRSNDAVHYPDLAVAIIKLMGPGEYMLMPAPRMILPATSDWLRATTRIPLRPIAAFLTW